MRAKRSHSARNGEQFVLAAAFQGGIQLKAEVEVVFHRTFAAAGDDDDVLDAGSNGLFNAILDDGLVDQRQHLFRNDFGGRQKARAKAARRKNRFAYILSFMSPVLQRKTHAIETLMLDIHAPLQKCAIEHIRIHGMQECIRA